jgi:hypothetical protein
VIGIPTDVVPNPWFGREIGVRPSDVSVLVLLSVLSGALLATYTVAGPGSGAARAGFGSVVIGWFAVGCPVCNKLVVALLGASGAAGTFASVQPLLGAAAIVLAAAALVIRVRAIRRGACPLPGQERSSTPRRSAVASAVSTQAAMNRSSSTSSGVRSNVRRSE